MYWFKRKYTQIKRTLSFLPIIWKGYDRDYMSAIDLFKHQLGRLATTLEGETAYGLDSLLKAQRIRTTIRLLDKVYDDFYGCEYQSKIEKIYGEDVYDFEFEDTGKGDDSGYLKHKYEYWNNADEIRELNQVLFHESNTKQKKAHRILWKYIEHNIQSWWD